MSAITVAATEYAVRRADLTHEQLIRMRRAYSGKMRSTVTNNANNTQARVWEIETEYLTAAAADALEAVLIATGTFILAGEVPGGTVTCRPGFPIERSEHMDDYAVLRFKAREVL